MSEGYSIRIWRTEDGLPQNAVTSTVQTRDGYLWLGTHSGLARFDGERFQVFDSSNTPELADHRVTSLFEDERGTLWIGQETGTLTRYTAGRFTAVPPASEPRGDQIIGLGSDEAGRVWAMHRDGSLDSVEDGQRVPSAIAPEPGKLMTWSRNEHGTIWIVENSQAYRLVDGRLVLTKFDPTYDVDYVSMAATSRDGGAWVFRDGLIRKWDGARWVENRGPFPGPLDTVSPCLELKDGTLALGTVNSGLYLLFGDSRPAVHLDQSNGLPHNWVRTLYEDRENNLWVGTGAGLAAVRTTAFSVLNAPDGWLGASVLAVAPGRGESLWIGTEGAGVYHSLPGRWEHFGEPEGLTNLYVWAVAETHGGEVWAGNYWWGGPYRLQDGRFVRPEAIDPQSSPVLALQPEARTDGLLIGRRDGLQRLDRSGASWLVKGSDIGAADVSAIVQESGGATWCAFTRGGLARIADGKVTVLRGKDGIGSDAIQCLFGDPDGTLWIGTADNGLTRLKSGRFANLGPAQGLADKAICHILDDGIGYFWLSTHHGIQRIAKEELNRCADGQIAAFASQTYDDNDGLPVIEFPGGIHAAACRTEDGRLLFASSKGVLSIDPARIQSNPTPPPVVIESLVIDGESAPLGSGAAANSIPPDHQRLEFRFSGLSYVAPNKVRFKYRLDGIDRTWVEAGGKRTAFYSHLPAGSYRFHVIAANNDGVWNTEGATLAITVLPYFWETWWFLGASALVVVAGVAVLVRHITRRRLQKRMEHLEHQHELERERTRIAQDIHDDIGTSLIRIAMFSQPQRNELDQPQQAAAVLSRIYSTAREMTRALDEIVWAIDPRHDTLDSLIGYMGLFAQELLGAAGIRCRLEVPDEVPTWPLTAEIRHNLFLAFKEALNNVVKHAAATEVHLSIEVRARAFVLTVRDNGRGFAHDQPAARTDGRLASGNGMRNIAQRIDRIGGRSEISSEPGKGTSIAFTIPF
ncbi:MAG TPA: two-component regulator propeller domain-containing protein [Opitutaceae bacterium]|nr:two-component regulator propeller domain-containing protein [Opitutaceae bacterium]